MNRLIVLFPNKSLKDGTEDLLKKKLDSLQNNPRDIEVINKPINKYNRIYSQVFESLNPVSNESLNKQQRFISCLINAKKEICMDSTSRLQQERKRTRLNRINKCRTTAFLNKSSAKPRLPNTKRQAPLILNQFKVK